MDRYWELLVSDNSIHYELLLALADARENLGILTYENNTENMGLSERE